MHVPVDRHDDPAAEPDGLRDPVADWEAFRAAREAHRTRLAAAARRRREAPRGERSPVAH